MYKDIWNAKELLDKQIITNVEYEKIKNKCFSKLITADLSSISLTCLLKEIDGLLELKNNGAIEDNSEFQKIFKLYMEELKNKQSIFLELNSKMLGAVTKRDYNLTIKCCDKILKMQPDDSDTQNTLLFKGDALFKLGNHEDALSCYENILKLDPYNKQVLMRLDQWY